MTQFRLIIVVAIVLAALIVIQDTVFIVNERQQVVITQFGRADVRAPIISPGLNAKIPFIQKAHYFEKRFLEWDGDQDQLTTKDKRFIFVDTYARWKITDPLQFFRRLRDERRAQSRLDDILDSATRNTIARFNLIEVVRNSNREMLTEEASQERDEDFETVEFGQARLASEVLQEAKQGVEDLGIELLDFRFKRLMYVPDVRREVYARMISERNRISEKFRSEGAGEAARIQGEKERELRTIRSEAYRDAQEIKGKADAEAADIYAAAYNRNPEFYRFLKSMDVYKNTIDADTTLLLGTDGEYLRYLERAK